MIEYQKKIDKLTIYLNESDAIINDLTIKYENEKKQYLVSSKKCEEYLNKITKSNETIEDLEQHIYNNKMELDKNQILIDNLIKDNKKLKKDLDTEEFKTIELETKINNLENDISNMIRVKNNIEKEDIFEPIIIKKEDDYEINTISLYEEIEKISEASRKQRNYSGTKLHEWTTDLCQHNWGARFSHFAVRDLSLAVNSNG